MDKKYEVISETSKTKLCTIEYIKVLQRIRSDTLNTKSFVGWVAHFGIDIKLVSVTLGVFVLLWFNTRFLSVPFRDSKYFTQGNGC